MKNMKDSISIEDSFQIIMLFLQNFWDDFLRKKMVQKGLIDSELHSTKKPDRAVPKTDKNKLHELNDFFFLIVCIGTSSSDYFEDIIEQRMHIPAIEQHQKLQITENMLFQLTIDFCVHFNKRFQKEGHDSLRFAIDWLEDMRKHPEKHITEWKIWNKATVDVIGKGKKSLGFF
jgi:hypothetical protein